MKPVIIIAIAVGCSVAIFFALSIFDVDDLVKTQIDPTLDDFKNTLNESQDIETIFSKFGEPQADIGSGIHIYVYELNDSTEIWIGYVDRILYVQHVDSDGNNLERFFDDDKS